MQTARFARVDERVRTEQPDRTVAERRREDIHDQRDERPEQRPCENPHEAGEVHVYATPDGDVQLEDRETRGRADAGERDLVRLDTAFPDPVDDGTDQSDAEQRPEYQCPQRKRAFSEVNVCHLWFANFGSDYNKVAVLAQNR